MDYEEKKEELLKVLRTQFVCSDINRVVEYMATFGLLQETSLTHYLIRHEYYIEHAKRDKNFTDIKHELAAKYDETFPNIRNIIYKK